MLFKQKNIHKLTYPLSFFLKQYYSAFALLIIVDALRTHHAEIKVTFPKSLRVYFVSKPEPYRL